MASSDGHDEPGLIGELVPGVAAVIDEIVGSLVKTRLESQLSRMNCQTFSCGFSSGDFRRQRHECDVGGHHEPGGEMPAGLVDQHGCMAAGRDFG